MNHFQRLPGELKDEIFAFFGNFPNSEEAPRNYTEEVFRRTYGLSTLSTVCRNWQHHAERLNFSIIALKPSRIQSSLNKLDERRFSYLKKIDLTIEFPEPQTVSVFSSSECREQYAQHVYRPLRYFFTCFAELETKFKTSPNIRLKIRSRVLYKVAKELWPGQGPEMPVYFDLYIPLEQLPKLQSVSSLTVQSFYRPNSHYPRRLMVDFSPKLACQIASRLTGLQHLNLLLMELSSNSYSSREFKLSLSQGLDLLPRGLARLRVVFHPIIFDTCYNHKSNRSRFEDTGNELNISLQRIITESASLTAFSLSGHFNDGFLTLLRPSRRNRQIIQNLQRLHLHLNCTTEYEKFSGAHFDKAVNDVNSLLLKAAAAAMDMPALMDAFIVYGNLSHESQFKYIFGDPEVKCQSDWNYETSAEVINAWTAVYEAKNQKTHGVEVTMEVQDSTITSTVSQEKDWGDEEISD